MPEVCVNVAWQQSLAPLVSVLVISLRGLRSGAST